MWDLRPIQDLERTYGPVLDEFGYDDAVYIQSGEHVFSEYKQMVSKLCWAFDTTHLIEKYYDFISEHGLSDIFNCGMIGFKKAVFPPVLAYIGNSRRVLDVGCNSGILTVTYALNMPDAQFVGLDMSKKSIEIAKARAAVYNCNSVEFIKDDLLHFKTDYTFDAIVATHVLHETQYSYSLGFTRCENIMLKEKLAKIREISRKGSKLVLSFQPNDESFADFVSFNLQEIGFEETDVKYVPHNKFGEEKSFLYIEAEAI